MPTTKDLLDQVFPPKEVEVDQEVRKFFLDTEQLRNELFQKQCEVTTLEQAITHREVIATKLAPGIELCHTCKGSGQGHSNVPPGNFGPPRPPCGWCHGVGFRKKPVKKEL